MDDLRKRGHEGWQMQSNRTPWTERSGKQGSSPMTQRRVGEKPIDEEEVERLVARNLLIGPMIEAVPRNGQVH